jgi:hypothetical protein
MRWTADGYRLASLNRLGAADLLRRQERFSLSMYVAGLAAECMLRAWRHPDRPFDERHDIARLFLACDLDRLGSHARTQLQAPLQTLAALWANGYRYAHDDQVRSHLREFGLDRDVPRKADKLKVKCDDLYDACAQIVTVGEIRWIGPKP